MYVNMYLHRLSWVVSFMQYPAQVSHWLGLLLGMGFRSAGRHVVDTDILQVSVIIHCYVHV